MYNYVMKNINNEKPDEVYDLERNVFKTLKMCFVGTPETKKLISRFASEHGKSLSSFMVDRSVAGEVGKEDFAPSIKNCIEDKSCDCAVCRSLRNVFKLKSKERCSWQVRLSAGELEAIKKRAEEKKLGVATYIKNVSLNFETSRAKDAWTCINECGCPVCKELRKGLEHSEGFSEYQKMSL